jgi:hypothetical protein
LKAPGLRPLKQVELYNNFRSFVPREFWEDTPPKASADVLAQVKDETAKKRKTKVAEVKCDNNENMAQVSANKRGQPKNDVMKATPPVKQTKDATVAKAATNANDLDQTESDWSE